MQRRRKKIGSKAESSQKTALRHLAHEIEKKKKVGRSNGFLQAIWPFFIYIIAISNSIFSFLEIAMMYSPLYQGAPHMTILI